MHIVSYAGSYSNCCSGVKVIRSFHVFPHLVNMFDSDDARVQTVYMCVCALCMQSLTLLQVFSDKRVEHGVDHTAALRLWTV